VQRCAWGEPGGFGRCCSFLGGAGLPSAFGTVLLPVPPSKRLSSQPTPPPSPNPPQTDPKPPLTPTCTHAPHPAPTPPDRNKLLFDSVCTLSDLNYDVYHAAVDCEGESCVQLYYIRPRFGDFYWDAVKATKLRVMLESAIQRRFPKGLKVGRGLGGWVAGWLGSVGGEGWGRG